MQKYIELLRKPMQVKPESLRAARQKSSSTPPHVYRLTKVLMVLVLSPRKH